MPPVTRSTDDPMFSPEWLERACVDLDDPGRDLVAKAAEWVARPLAGKQASTGEPLDEHCAKVVLILARLGADAATRAGALLTTLPPDHGRSGSADAVAPASHGTAGTKPAGAKGSASGDQA